VHIGWEDGVNDNKKHILPSGDSYQAVTLSGNPLAMAAGFETLNALTEKDYDLMNQKIDRLIAGYQKAAETHDVPLQVNRAGSMVGVFFTDEPVINFETAQTSDTDLFAKYYRGMIEEGIFLPPSQFEGLFLSTSHSDEDIDHTIAAVQNVFASFKE